MIACIIIRRKIIIFYYFFAGNKLFGNILTALLSLYDRRFIHALSYDLQSGKKEHFYL